VTILGDTWPTWLWGKAQGEYATNPAAGTGYLAMSNGEWTAFSVAGDGAATNESDPVWAAWRTNAAAGTTNAILPDGSLVNIAGMLGGGSATVDTMTSAETNWWHNRAVLLDPGAIEPVLGASTAWVYQVGANTTKWLTASWATRLGATGRFEVRDPAKPYPLRNVTMDGLAGASACILDPQAASYAAPKATYYSRMQTIETADSKAVHLNAPSKYVPLLPGAYGAIITRAVNVDFVWLIAQSSCGIAWNLANEIGDTAASDYIRFDNALSLAVDKKTLCEIGSGGERSAGVGRGSVSYYLCPSNWSGVADTNVYLFRDDFMGAALDGRWTRIQGTVGGVEINPDYGWCQLTSTSGLWNCAGAYTTQAVTRAAGRSLIADVYCGRDPQTVVGYVVGWHDGDGLNYTDFSHCIDFGYATTNVLYIFENGNNRGIVGTYANGTVARLRLTLGATNCTYEIQGGGTSYPPIGGVAWANLLAPALSYSPDASMRYGFSCASTGAWYVGDARITQ